MRKNILGLFIRLSERSRKIISPIRVLLLLAFLLLAGTGLSNSLSASATGTVTPSTTGNKPTPTPVKKASQKTTSSIGGGAWGWQDSFATKVTRLNGISCPSETSCYAVGNDGVVLYPTKNGGTWSTKSSSSNTLNGISCPAANICYAVGVSGTIEVTTDSGKTWDVLTSGIASDLNSISCPAANICYAVGASGTIEATTDSGKTWDVLTSGIASDLNSISCPNSNTCFAVGASGTIVASSNKGVNWTVQTSGTPNNLNSISCPNATACFAFGSAGTIVATSNGTNIWAIQNSGIATDLFGISCPNANVCFGVGWGGTIMSTTNSGANWNARTSITGNGQGISCTSTLACSTALSNPGTIWATSDSGVSWTEKPTFNNTGLNHISCPSETTCFAVGYFGTILATTDGNTWFPQSSGTEGRLWGIECPSETTCIAVGDEGTLETTIDGGTTWITRTADTANNLSAISCPSETTCFAVGNLYDTNSKSFKGVIVETTNVGVTWTAKYTTALNQQLTGISCPDALTCFVVNTKGAIIVTKNGGNTWGVRSFNPSYYLNGITCPTVTTCYAVGNAGVILATTNGGYTWFETSVGTFTTPSGSSSTTSLLDISCRTALICYAVGTTWPNAFGVSISIVATINGGETWVTQDSGTITYLGSVSCPTDSVCFAVAAVGGAGVAKSFVPSSPSLVITTQPGSSTIGGLLNPQPVVKATKADGVTTDTTYTGSIAVTLSGGASGAVLGGTKTVKAVNGVATFTDLSVNLAGAGYGLTFTGDNLISVNSEPFYVAGPVVKLAFTTQPRNSNAGLPFPKQVVVQAQDSSDYPNTSFTGSITLTLSGGATDAYLNGTTTVTAINGVASFTDLSIDKVGKGYILTASNSNLTSAVSSSFNIIPVDIDTGGNIWVPQFTEQNTTMYGISCPSETTCFAMGWNSGGGIHFDTTMLYTNDGGNTWITNSVNAPSMYAISCPNATTCFAVSSLGTIVATIDGGTTWTTRTADTANNLRAISCPSVTTCYAVGDSRYMGSDDRRGTIVSTTDGGDTWTSKSIDTAMWLRDISCPSATTCFAAGRSSYDFYSGAIVSTTDGGTTWATRISVNTNDGLAGISCPSATTCFAAGSIGYNGTIVSTTDGGITWTDQILDTNTGLRDISCPNVLTCFSVGNGGTIVSTWTTQYSYNTGDLYGISCPSVTVCFATGVGGIVATNSLTFLSFETQPGSSVARGLLNPQLGSSVAGGLLNPQPVVKVKNPDGITTNTTYTGTLTVTLSGGASGAVLGGTKTVKAVNGVATFTDLSVNLAGTGYTLTTSSELIGGGVSSSTFNVAAGATKLAFTVQPITALAGAAFAQNPIVTVQDANGNTATFFSGSVTLTLSGGASGAVLGGTKTVKAVNGVATFTDLSVNLAGTGYILTAAATGLTGDSSSAFEVVAGCSVQALKFAVSSGGTLDFACAADTTITLTEALPSISKDLTLTNTGSGKVTISGASTYQLFSVNSGKKLYLNNLTFVEGAASKGGVIYNNNGTVAITNSTFSNNSATIDGGAIYNNSGTVTVNNSTFSGNSATNGKGGAIYNNNGTLAVSNSTFSGNSATTGGAIHNSNSVTLKNTLINGSNNCSGTITDGGYNLDSGNTCGFNAGSSKTNTDPKLATLANNGGPTQTLKLLVDSPAIGAGSCSVGTTDQRGFPRLSPCSIGAVDNRPVIQVSANSEADFRASVSNAAPGTVLVFNSTGTLTLTQPIVISSDLILDGTGQQITLNGGVAGQALQVNNNGSLTLSRLTIIGGSSTQGSAIYNNNGKVTLDSCTIQGSVYSGGSPIIFKNTNIKAGN
ncbi:choice-of-anchor Q domain-containing protein [Candidatus Chlorohelix sp.]|uniref:choice-of-anchor Q domain-containing protein n=1 Tax=Candidatus Chlorohelix sp. TaxID=3139201 RepID=UPI0030295234